jgi:hypothetical protein
MSARSGELAALSAHNSGDTTAPLLDKPVVVPEVYGVR